MVVDRVLPTDVVMDSVDKVQPTEVVVDSADMAVNHSLTFYTVFQFIHLKSPTMLWHELTNIYITHEQYITTFLSS